MLTQSKNIVEHIIIIAHYTRNKLNHGLCLRSAYIAHLCALFSNIRISNSILAIKKSKYFFHNYYLDNIPGRKRNLFGDLVTFGHHDCESRVGNH